MSKNPNEHFISVANIAIQLCELDLTQPMNLILANIQMSNLSALAKIALEKEANAFRDSNGRPVVDLEVEGRGVDAFFSAATYDDDGSKVSDDELDYLTKTYPETIEEHCSDRHAMRCEDAYDASRGH